MKDTDINRLKRDLRDAQLILQGNGTIYIVRSAGGNYTIPDDLRAKLKELVIGDIKVKLARAMECEVEEL